MVDEQKPLRSSSEYKRLFASPAMRIGMFYVIGED